MLKNNRLPFLPKALTAFLLAAVCLTGCGAKEEQPVLLQEELLTSEQADYKTVPVITADYKTETSGQASVVYLLSRNLYWESNSAYFKETKVKIGQEVKAGDILMVFNTETNVVELETLKLQLTRAREDTEEQNAENQAELNAARASAQELQGYDLQIATLEIEKMQAAHAQFLYQAEKEMAQIQERIDALSKAAEENVVTAPFDGVISEVTKFNEGDQVAAGQFLVSLYSTDKFLLQAEDSTNKLRYNANVTIEVGRDENRKTYSGKVIVAPHILPSSVSTDLTLVELDEDVSSDLLKGTIRYRGISEEVYNILQIEKKAIEREAGKEFVYILDGDMVQKRYIKTTLHTVDAAWVLDGLYEGQTLIVD